MRNPMHLYRKNFRGRVTNVSYHVTAIDQRYLDTTSKPILRIFIEMLSYDSDKPRPFPKILFELTDLDPINKELTLFPRNEVLRRVFTQKQLTQHSRYLPALSSLTGPGKSHS